MKQSACDWQLSGWGRGTWRMALAVESGCNLRAEVPPLSCRVPGSVQQALLEAGLLPDWQSGIQARACEWVENRDWMYECRLPAGLLKRGEGAALSCEGIDGPAELWVNGHQAGVAGNAFRSWRFELDPWVDERAETHLQLMLLVPPRGTGQFGRTSRTTASKPRFYYGWDWCVRMVQVGLYGRVSIVTGMDRLFARIRAQSAVSESGEGMVMLHVDGYAGAYAPEKTVIRIRVMECKTGAKVADTTMDPARLADVSGVSLSCGKVRLWQVNGGGAVGAAQALYQVTVEAIGNGQTASLYDRRIGFRRLDWRACRNAPPQAEPWLCRVNGKAIFLQGVNWTPVRPNFADVTPSMEQERLRLYAAMGVNFIRVWGGAMLADEAFYDCCDELGLLVMQEFPLCGAGLESRPPDAPAVMQEFAAAAEDYIWRRSHHASLALWSGGNELQSAMDGSDGTGKPYGLEQPLQEQLADLVRRLDGGRRFQPTSPYGPRAFAAEDYGQGLHWDVHGPWNILGDTPEAWAEFWAKDDALLRSEVGVPGATSPELIRQYAGGLSLEPYTLDNPFWNRFYWYLDEPFFEQEFGRKPASLEEYCAWSQTRQANGLATAAAACKRRFPECGGIVIWMGHDACPCPANLSIVNYDGTPKLAVAALAAVFHGEAADEK